MTSNLKFDVSQELETNRAEVEWYFGPKSSGKAAQALKHDEPAKYAELRDLAQRLGLIGKGSTEQAVASLRTIQKKPRTAEEYGLLEEFPRDKVKDFITSVDYSNLTNPKHEKFDPYEAERYRAAAVLHGLLAPRGATVNVRPTPQPKEDNGQLTELPLNVTQELGLEPGFKVTRVGREKAYAALGAKRVREAEDKAAEERAAFEKRRREAA